MGIFSKSKEWSPCECGNPAEVVTKKTSNYWQVRCMSPKCGKRGPWRKRRRYAIDDWNMHNPGDTNR